MFLSVVTTSYSPTVSFQRNARNFPDSVIKIQKLCQFSAIFFLFEKFVNLFKSQNTELVSNVNRLPSMICLCNNPHLFFTYSHTITLRILYGCLSYQTICPFWSPWGRLSECDLTCGGGIQTRMRTCMEGNPGDDGCLGPDTDTLTCNTQVWFFVFKN